MATCRSCCLIHGPVLPYASRQPRCRGQVPGLAHVDHQVRLRPTLLAVLGQQHPTGDGRVWGARPVVDGLGGDAGELGRKVGGDRLVIAVHNVCAPSQVMPAACARAVNASRSSAGRFASR